MPPLMQTASESWEVAASLTLLIVLAGVVYLRGWLQLRAACLNLIPALRAGSFLLGLALAWIAVASPLASVDGRMLTGHMVQHLLLMTFAPPLIWLGAPVLAMLYPLRAASPLFRWPPLKR